MPEHILCNMDIVSQATSGVHACTYSSGVMEKNCAQLSFQMLHEYTELSYDKVRKKCRNTATTTTTTTPTLFATCKTHAMRN